MEHDIVDRAVATLNLLLAEEPKVTQVLFTLEAPISSDTLTKIPDLCPRVQPTLQGERISLSVLGLLNTVLGSAHGEHGYLAVWYDHLGGPVQRFVRFHGCETCAATVVVASDVRRQRALTALNALLAEEPLALHALLSLTLPIKLETAVKVGTSMWLGDRPILTVLELINLVLGVPEGGDWSIYTRHVAEEGPIEAFIGPPAPVAAATAPARAQSNPWGYALSDSPEQWEHADSREEAIQRGCEAYPGEPFYIIEGTRCTTEEFLPSAESIVDGMNERACDDVGDPAEDWPDVTNEGGAVLAALLTQWAEKYVTPPGFWLADGTPERIEPDQAPWGYSAEEDPDEWLPANSREDAISKGRERFPGGGFYITSCAAPPSGDVADADIEEELRRIDSAAVPEFIEPEPAALPTPPEPEEVS